MPKSQRAAKPRAPAPATGRLPRTARPRSAVVIDDHDGLRGAIVEMLEHQGWTVHGFSSVEEAHPFVRASLPDVVLTDINVGIYSGAALARELRMDPSTSALAIVAMSGSTHPTERMAALFDEFLLKPIELATLDATLRQAIVRRRET